MHGRKGPSKILKKTGKQSTLQEPVSVSRPAKEKTVDGTMPVEEQLAPLEMKLEPITDKRSYDTFLRNIALRVYHEFETSLRGEGVERPEICLVGFDAGKATTPAEARMGDYVALNARLMVETAFVNLQEYAAKDMPRVMRHLEAEGGELATRVESKVQRDLTMEIRAFAMQHIPEGERFRYINKLKEF